MKAADTRMPRRLWNLHKGEMRRIFGIGVAGNRFRPLCSPFNAAFSFATGLTTGLALSYAGHKTSTACQDRALKPPATPKNFAARNIQPAAAEDGYATGGAGRRCDIPPQSGPAAGKTGALSVFAAGLPERSGAWRTEVRKRSSRSAHRRKFGPADCRRPIPELPQR